MFSIIQSNVTVMAKDLNKSIAFYESIGLKLKKRWGDHYAQVASDDLIIGLHPSNENRKASSQISIGFMIDDIKDAETLLTKNNIKFKRGDGKAGIILNFLDPDGTNLYFGQFDDL